MPSLSGRYPVFYPAEGSPLIPFEGNFLAMAQSIANMLNGYALPIGVTNQAQRDQLFPSPTEGDRVYRKDLSQEQLYTSGNWVFLSGLPSTGSITYGSLYKDHPTYQSLRLTREGERVSLQGTVTTKQQVIFDANTSYPVLTIPTGWRPNSGDQPFAPIIMSGSSNVMGWATVLSSGQLNISLSAANTAPAENGMALSIDLAWKAS